MKVRRDKFTNKIIGRGLFATFGMFTKNEELINEVYMSDFGSTFLPEDRKKFSSIDELKFLRKHYLPFADEIRIIYRDKYISNEYSIFNRRNGFDIDIINDNTVIFKGKGIFSNEIKIEKLGFRKSTWMPLTQRLDEILHSEEDSNKEISKLMVSYIEFKDDNIYKPRFCVEYCEFCEDINFTLTFYKDIKVINKKKYYHEYLKSKRWQNTREGILKKRGSKCQLCGDISKNFHVHHNTYDRVGFEKDEDLIILCNECHAKFHNKIDKIS